MTEPIQSDDGNLRVRLSEHPDAVVSVSSTAAGLFLGDRPVALAFLSLTDATIVNMLMAGYTDLCMREGGNIFPEHRKRVLEAIGSRVAAKKLEIMQSIGIGPIPPKVPPKKAGKKAKGKAVKVPAKPTRKLNKAIKAKMEKPAKRK